MDRLRFSSLPGQAVRSGNVTVGRIADGVVRLVEFGNPPLVGLVAERDGQAVFIPSRYLERIDQTGAELSSEPPKLDPFERRAGEVLLGRDLLDHKLIFIHSRLRPRLVRADDLVLGPGPAGKGWSVTGIDVAEGVHRLKRRLRHLLKTSPAQETVESSATFVPWGELEPFVAHVPTARRRLSLRKLRKMHPAQIADLLEEASEEEGREILDALEDDQALEADVIEELEPVHRLDAVRDRSDAEVAELLAAMAPDDAADLLTSLDQGRRARVLELIPAPQQKVVTSLLGYHPETAGGLMTPSVVCLPEMASVQDALDAIRSRTDLPENLGGVFVRDTDGHLSGYVALTKILTAKASVVLANIAQPDPPRVGPNRDLVEVAVTMADYNLTSLAVVDETDTVLGIVTVDDVLARVLPAGWRRRVEALPEA
ncbi:MAG: CBS domain-containing protein [Actinobacteria bacterium]|nr:CBS domain-containing protein [Actinomycetota bacterium]